MTGFLDSSSPMDKALVGALWRSERSKRINILIWIMLNGNLNMVGILRRKSAYKWLLPSICFLCYKAGESLNHLLFECVYASSCWFKPFHIFYIHWVFSNIFKDNVLQVLTRIWLELYLLSFWLLVQPLINRHLGVVYHSTVT